MAIDPFSLGLSGLAMIMNRNMQSGAMQQSYRAQAAAERAAREQRRLAMAGRTDQYGNKTRYNDALNEWETILTPSQKQLTKAGEREQILSLTKDAPQNRRIRQRAGERGNEAAEDFNRERAEYRYGGPESEGAIRDELTKLLAQASTGRRNARNADLSRAIVRSGGGVSVADLNRNPDGDMGTLAEIMLKARSGAKDEYAQRSNQHRQETLPDMQFLSQLMDAGGDAPLRFSGPIMAGEQGDMAKLLQAALSSGNDLVSKATNASLALGGKEGLDLRGMASLYSALRGTPQKTVTPVASSTRATLDTNGSYRNVPQYDWGTADIF